MKKSQRNFGKPLLSRVDDEISCQTVNQTGPLVSTFGFKNNDDNNGSTILSRRKVWEITRKLSEEEQVSSTLGELGQTVRPLSPNERTEFGHILHSELRRYENKWIEANYKTSRFETKSGAWADGAFRVPLTLFSQSPSGSNQETGNNVAKSLSSGASSKRFKAWEELAPRSQRHHVQSLSTILQPEPLPKVMAAAAKVAQIAGEKDLALIIKAATSSPTKPRQLIQALESGSKSVNPYTPDEALAVIIDQNLSVSTYQFLQQDLNRRGFHSFPPYYKVLQAKAKCHSEVPITVNERSASVPLESLLHHTARRIVELQSQPLDELFKHLKSNELEFTLHCSWGFDGSTGQSKYQQKFENSEEDDHSLFATTLIPLKLVTANEVTLWLNPSPQSVRYCRPLRLQFRKETHDLIRAERRWVDEQIEKLSTLTITTIDGKKVRIDFNLWLTVIDGKVLSVLTGSKAYGNCSLCGAKPSEMNHLNLVKEKLVPPEKLTYGLSPLHAWIRVLEFLLKLSYREHPKVQTWRVAANSKAADIVNERKAKIQETVKKEIGVALDFVKQGGSGTTNDGNAARRVLSDGYRKRFAEVLELEEWLLTDLHAVLVAISSGLPLSPTKYGEFCHNIAERYIERYPWYYMPPSIHKMLIHGEDIIRTCLLPVGMLSEQAGESCNKIYKRYREFHSRKNSRINTITDMFNRSLESSDPVISYYTLAERRHKLIKHPLNGVVASLLEPYEVVHDDESPISEPPDIIFQDSEGLVLESELDD